jgi:hypothetical protein
MMEYAALHMKIVPCEFKATAVARIRDLHELLRALEARGTVRTQAAVRMHGATSRHAASVCLGVAMQRQLLEGRDRQREGEEESRSRETPECVNQASEGNASRHLHAYACKCLEA